jgi:hypothetical protein
MNPFHVDLLYNSKTCFCYAHSNAAYSLNFELTYEIVLVLLSVPKFWAIYPVYNLERVNPED